MTFFINIDRMSNFAYLTFVTLSLTLIHKIGLIMFKHNNSINIRGYNIHLIDSWSFLVIYFFIPANSHNIDSLIKKIQRSKDNHFTHNAPLLQGPMHHHGKLRLGERPEKPKPLFKNTVSHSYINKCTCSFKTTVLVSFTFETVQGVVYVHKHICDSSKYIKKGLQRWDFKYKSHF